MTATLLDGKAAAADLRAHLKSRLEALRQNAVTPALRIILVGEAEPARLYADRLVKAAENIGVSAAIDATKESLDETELVGMIASTNEEPNLDGVVVAMPLPGHLSGMAVSAALDPSKDVDGITITNAGKLYLGEESHIPSTAAAIMHLLNVYDVPLSGQNAVVVGRSPVVGKPATLLLLREHATVTVAHTRTHDLPGLTGKADIVVAAAGRAGLIRGEMLKPGAVVIDTGINVVDGRVVGDVVFEEAVEIASAITPVPGGVGPLTNVLLLTQVVDNAERRLSSTGLDSRPL